jgi:hypothetical protein
MIITKVELWGTTQYGLVKRFTEVRGERPGSAVRIDKFIETTFWILSCVTNRKVAGSIPDVSGFFIDIKSFRSHYGPGVDSASNRNEYQQYFLGGKGGRCVRLIT